MSNSSGPSPNPDNQEHTSHVADDEMEGLAAALSADPNMPDDVNRCYIGIHSKFKVIICTTFSFCDRR